MCCCFEHVGGRDIFFVDQGGEAEAHGAPEPGVAHHHLRGEVQGVQVYDGVAVAGQPAHEEDSHEADHEADDDGPDDEPPVPPPGHVQGHLLHDRPRGHGVAQLDAQVQEDGGVHDAGHL